MLSETDARELQMVRANLLALQERLRTVEAECKFCKDRKDKLEAASAKVRKECIQVVEGVRDALKALERKEADQRSLTLRLEQLAARLALTEQAGAALAEQVRAELERLDRLRDVN